MKPELRLEKEVQENKKLYKFLMKNGAYSKFMVNAANYIKNTNLSEGLIINVIKRGDSPILHAFIWKETSEGKEYWEDLHEKYKHLK